MDSSQDSECPCPSALQNVSAPMKNVIVPTVPKQQDERLARLRLISSVSSLRKFAMRRSSRCKHSVWEARLSLSCPCSDPPDQPISMGHTVKMLLARLPRLAMKKYLSQTK